MHGRFGVVPAFGVLAAAMVSGCGGDSDGSLYTPEEVLEYRLGRAVDRAGLTGNPAEGLTVTDIASPKAQLGMQLYFSKALGGDQDAACVSCHHPMLGGGDGLSLPVGVEAELPDLLGPGRTHSSAGTDFDGGPTVPRNSPSVINLALWKTTLFHDGRIEVLDGGGIRTPDSSFGVADPNAGPRLATAQARFPVTSKQEMRGFTFEAYGDNDDVRTHLEERLQGIVPELATNNWLDAFRIGYEDPTGTAADLITYANIADAIAAYQESQVLVDTPWREYLEGNDEAISASAKRGALLFLTSTDNGGAGCVACHSGDFFTDEQFHVIGMVQIGRGKGNGTTTTNDFGRFRETGVEDDRFAFRTPQLINVAATGPWGHAGAYTTLEGVVRHHLNPRQAVDNYDLTQLEAGVQVDDLVENTGEALDKLDALRLDDKSLLQNVALSDGQVDDLLAFLNTLTDPCLLDRACMSPWIASDSLADPDELRLKALAPL